MLEKKIIINSRRLFISCTILLLLFVNNIQTTTNIKEGITAPDWPNAFSVPFDVTVLPSCPGVCCDKSDIKSCIVQPIGIYGMSAKLYYDYSLFSERIDFTGCSANGTPNPCTFIFNATGGFLIQEEICCQAVNVGTVFPNWTSVLTYRGEQQAYNTNTQLFSGAIPLHSYFYSNETNSPVQLLVHDINELWHFTEPFNVAPQSSDLFNIPSDCSSSCDSFFKMSDNIPGLSFHRLRSSH